MIPIPTETKTKLIRWIPHVLNGYDYPVIETDNIVPELAAPAITFYLSASGKSTLDSNMIIRTVRQDDGSLDDHWGQFHSATMAVVLRELDKARLGSMWADFILKVHQTRRNLLLRIDKVRILPEILNSVQLTPERLPTNDTMYWAQVDIEIEYEMSAVSDADLIKTVHHDLTTAGSDRVLEFDQTIESS